MPNIHIPTGAQLLWQRLAQPEPGKPHHGSIRLQEPDDLEARDPHVLPGAAGASAPLRRLRLCARGDLLARAALPTARPPAHLEPDHERVPRPGRQGKSP